MLLVAKLIAPMKEKKVRCNQAPFINKDLCRGIMTRTRLLTIIRKKSSNENRKIYKQLQNCSVRLLEAANENLCSNLNARKISDNKLFLKNGKSNVTDETLKYEKLNLVGNEKVIPE